MNIAVTRVLVATSVLTLVGIGAARLNGGSRSAEPTDAESQVSQDFPTFVLPAVTVEGSVSVINTPTVNAQQAGAWNVNLLNVPTVLAQQAGVWKVSLAGGAPTTSGIPGFLRVGGTYAFGWTTSADAETYRVVALGPGGWIQVQPVGALETTGLLWLNTPLATTIEEVD
jgi:hypothetical protein